jgi:hypothetical protein
MTEKKFGAAREGGAKRRLVCTPVECQPNRRLIANVR